MEPFSYCIIIGISGEASANGVTEQQQQIIEREISQSQVEPCNNIVHLHDVRVIQEKVTLLFYVGL